MKPKFSVIITTYDVPQYILECLESFKNFDNLEILVGIDGCEKTKKVLENNKVVQNCRVFYFPKNWGTYTIKNNLISKTNGEIILFFDSDDIVNTNIFKRYDENFDIVRLKFKEFGSSTNVIEVAQGVFFIKKSVLSEMVGFQPWRCNADVEFRLRAIFNKIKLKEDDTISFLRRKHEKNLTITKLTGMNSELRKSYEKIIEEKIIDNNWENPNIEIKEYYEL